MRLSREKNINTQEHWNARYEQIKLETHEHTMLGLFFKMNLLPVDEPYSLMDVGCGTGKHFRYLKENFNKDIDFYGCDISDVAIKWAQENLEFGEYYCLDLHRDKIPGVYDYVTCYHTLEHFNHPIPAVMKMRKVCRKKVLICVPYADNWSYELEHMHMFNENEPFKNYDNFLLDGEGSCIYEFSGLCG